MCSAVPSTAKLNGLRLGAEVDLFCPSRYGSGGALYMRPFIFGSGPKLGLGPSNEYTFIVFCNPTGSYYGSGGMQAGRCYHELRIVMHATWPYFQVAKWRAGQGTYIHVRAGDRMKHAGIS